MGTRWPNMSSSRSTSLYQQNTVVSTKIERTLSWKTFLWELGCQFLLLFKGPNLEFSLHVLAGKLNASTQDFYCWGSMDLSSHELLCQEEAPFPCPCLRVGTLAAAPVAAARSCCSAWAPFHPSPQSQLHAPLCCFLFFAHFYVK